MEERSEFDGISNVKDLFEGISFYFVEDTVCLEMCGKALDIKICDESEKVKDVSLLNEGRCTLYWH